METVTRPNNSLDRAYLPALHCAKEIHWLSRELPPMMQAVFRAWLRTQSCGQIESGSLEEIFQWLSMLNSGRADAEYHLMLLEISWLEMLAQDFFNFLSKDAI